MLKLGKQRKYIVHTIVPDNTTMKDQYTIKLQTFASYHPILYLTHRLAVYHIVLLYHFIVWCSVWWHLMDQLNDFIPKVLVLYKI
jgi:hypothetical protein